MVNFRALWKRSSPPAQKAPAYADVCAALARIRPSLPITPLTHSPGLSELLGHDVYLKWDNKLKTGSFKERGAVNFIANLSEEARARGLCAASAGNHALALSHHAARAQLACHIVMPESAPLVKVQSTKARGAHVTLHGLKFDESYEYAKELSKKHGYTFVPAFDHADIIAGQGTCGLEILEQLRDVDSIVIPVGGGGLASGIGIAVKEKHPDCFILGVQSAWAEQSEENFPADLPPTLRPITIADGIAVKKATELTAAILKEKTDALCSVSEAEIARSIIHFLEIERTVVEGAGAAGLAGLLTGKLPPRCRRTVIVVSGSNIDMNLLSHLIEHDMGECGRILRIRVAIPDRPGALHTISGIVAANGANILEVLHDRSFSKIPGNVDVSFLLEVRDNEHRAAIIQNLTALGLAVREET